MQDGVPGHEVHASLGVLRSFSDFLHERIHVVFREFVELLVKLNECVASLFGIWQMTPLEHAPHLIDTPGCPKIQKKACWGKLRSHVEAAEELVEGCMRHNQIHYRFQGRVDDRHNGTEDNFHESSNGIEDVEVRASLTFCSALATFCTKGST